MRNKMIVITDIKYCEVNTGITEHLKYSDVPILDNTGDFVECNVVRELVHGRSFVRPSDRKEIIIGVSKQAQDIIGIQYESWGVLERKIFNTGKKLEAAEQEIEIKKHSLDTAYQKIEAAIHATFFTRLKWLFVGFK